MKKLIIILTIVFTQFSFARPMDTSCSQALWYDRVVIVPSSINSTISESYFPNETGMIGVTAEVSGNGNTRKFTHNFEYKRVGSRLELDSSRSDSIRTNASLEDFTRFFGLFPEIICFAR